MKMLLCALLIQYLAIASATHEYIEKSIFRHSFALEDMETDLLSRTVRDTTKEKMAPDTPSCPYMKHTQSSPFVVLMLFKTSGRFLGMGSIIDKETIITSVNVVRNTVEKPSQLLTLAGRLNPWWGDGSQVQPAKYIHVHGTGLTLVRLTEPLVFNKYVKAIRIIKNNPEDYAKVFTSHWGIVGIPRGVWNIPGDLAERTSIYLMKIETEPDKPDDKKQCPATYQDVDFSEGEYTCTIANFTFGWGCVGSPLLGVDKQNKLQQIGVVIDVSRIAKEKYHLHLKIGSLVHWIKAHSLIGFVEEPE